MTTMIDYGANDDDANDDDDNDDDDNDDDDDDEDDDGGSRHLSSKLPSKLTCVRVSKLA